MKNLIIYGAFGIGVFAICAFGAGVYDWVSASLATALVTLIFFMGVKIGSDL